MMADHSLPPSRLRPADTLRVAFSSLRARPLRAVLSALGIAIGIAAMVAVVGISASSQEQVNQQLRELGTDLLTVEAGTSFRGGEAKLPTESIATVTRLEPVSAVSAIGMIDDAHVYRNEAIDPRQTNALAVYAADTGLLETVSGTIASGRWLDDALASYPTVVLGSSAADLLGISHTDGSVNVWLADHWFNVVGILDPVPLAPELDMAALIGWPIAIDLLGFDAHPTTLYQRSHDESVVEQVRFLLPPTVNPSNPEEVAVSRPSDALAAQVAVDETLTTLLLALGAVALLVGGIGVANTMVIAVLERRSEVGLRRALGATRGHIRRQFLGESVLLASFGGIGGALLGAIVTAAFAASRSWQFALPLWVLAGATAATVLVGALAGVYPAGRAARMPPTAALSTV